MVAVPAKAAPANSDQRWEAGFLGASVLHQPDDVAGWVLELGGGDHAAEGFGAPAGTRTPNPQVRSLVLYPIELRALRDETPTPAGALSDGNYTAASNPSREETP